MLKFAHDQEWIGVMVIGGFNGSEYNGKTWRYGWMIGDDFKAERAPMEYLNEARGYHECTVFSSLNHDDRQVALVAGGQNWYGPVLTVEILDYQMSPSVSWVTGKLIVILNLTKTSFVFSYFCS